MSKVREGVKYEKQYTEENVLSALEVIENEKSQRNASETVNVPHQTLQFRNSSKFTNKTTLGPTSVLTSEEESILEELERKHEAAKLLDKALNTSPAREGRIRKVWSVKQPICYTPEEALLLMVEANLTKSQYKKICQNTKHRHYFEENVGNIQSQEPSTTDTIYNRQNETTNSTADIEIENIDIMFKENGGSIQSQNPSTTYTTKNKKENKANCSFSDYIVWSKTPERKGKKRDQTTTFRVNQFQLEKIAD
ncbi:hypothetical protein ILUMI_11452 [Ignelater luminosus]|uniref:Uncharacterized protein n=1 Tax=Ignelater luminosus TaxID=2038154 RepID=A0A8K0G7Q3_IGNLU|nr:hypothetical protein ILUMI_11452 [Ignelater luminosus]